MRILNIALALTLFCLPGNGCEITWPTGEEHTAWEVLIRQAPDIFIGEVIAIEGTEPGRQTAVLRVEEPVRGALGDTYEVPQGAGEDCRTEYRAGDVLLFAGHAPPNASFFISEPLTPEQRRRLAIIRVEFLDADGKPLDR